jgi:hypothetical protein
MDELEKYFEDEKNDSITIKIKRSLFENLFFMVLSVLITFPFFIIVYRYVPDLVLGIGKGIRIDHILTFLIIFGIIRLIVGLLRYWMVGLLIAALIVLTLNQFTDRYGFSNAYSDYRDMISYVESNPIKIPFISEKKMTIRHAREIREAIDYQNTDVRRFAVKSSLMYFNEKELYQEYGQIVRYFSVFKVINEWNYIQDPKDEDYYATASESIELLAGDCDDHSILMAACIKAIGGEVRIIHTEGHLYPEVKVGKEEDLNRIVFLIKRELFYKESLGERIFYHLDNEGNVWLNLDYTGKYPGARFLNEKILGILEV